MRNDRAARGRSRAARADGDARDRRSGRDGLGALQRLEPDGAGIFDSVGSLTAATSAARGGDVVREPILNATYETVAESRRKNGGPGFRATVPVWFHVVSDGELANVTQAQIDAQLTVLNLAFAGFYSGAKSGFRFELAGVTRTDNADWFYAGIGGSGERPMKKALHVGGFETVNVYSTTAGPYLGWTYLPGLPDSQLYLDGIVSDWKRCRVRPIGTKASTTSARR